MAGACFYLMERGRTVAAARTFAVGAIILMAALFGFGTVQADRHQHSDVLLQAIRQRSLDPQIATLGCLEPSWVFYARQPLRPVLIEQLHDDTRGYFAPGRESFVITTRTHLAELESHLPDGVQVLAEAPYFLKDEQLVVLGRPHTSISTAAKDASRSRR
jgi:hypothetical protein